MSRDNTTNQPIDRVLSGSIHQQAVEEVGAPLKRYYSLDICQLRPGDYQSRLDFIASSGAIIYRENYPRATRIMGELLGGRFGLGIRLGETGGTFAGEQVLEQKMPSAMSGEQIDFTGESGYRQMIMAVDHAKLLQMAEAACVAPRILQSLSPGRQGMNLSTNPNSAACIAKTFGKMLDRAVAGQIDARQEYFEDLIYEAIISLVEHADLSYGRPSAAAIVRRATELVEGSPGMVPRVHVLAARLRMNPRTLQKAFISVTGLGPNSYFRHCSLNRARHALLQADPAEDKVTAIATGLGFTEIGRFSVRYRELFGESPLQTLQRRPRCIVAIPG